MFKFFSRSESLASTTSPAPAAATDRASLLANAATMNSAELADKAWLVPSSSGIYAWWFKRDSLPVPFDGTLEREGYHFLYVGISPRAPAANGKRSSRTLRNRIRDHCCGPIAISTLRRSIAALLTDRLALQIYCRANGKLAMSDTDEAKLSDWISQNAKVAWICDDEPWVLEDELIGSGPSLPLNIRGSSHPFRQNLLALRAPRALSRVEEVLPK